MRVEEEVHENQKENHVKSDNKSSNILEHGLERRINCYESLTDVITINATWSTQTRPAKRHNLCYTRAYKRQVWREKHFFTNFSWKKSSKSKRERIERKEWSNRESLVKVEEWRGLLSPLLFRSKAIQVEKLSSVDFMSILPSLGYHFTITYSICHSTHSIKVLIYTLLLRVREPEAFLQTLHSTYYFCTGSDTRFNALFVSEVPIPETLGDNNFLLDRIQLKLQKGKDSSGNWIKEVLLKKKMMKSGGQSSYCSHWLKFARLGCTATVLEAKVTKKWQKQTPSSTLVIWVCFILTHFEMYVVCVFILIELAN